MIVSLALLFAFQVKDPIHDACHERIALASMQSAQGGGYVRASDRAAPLSDADRRYITHAEGALTQYPQDIATAALITGVRYNDSLGNGDFQMNHLATVHNKDADQRNHCLRRRAQDFEAGDVAALEDCKSYIREEFENALGTLGADGFPNAAREDVIISDPFAGRFTVPLPRFYFRAGRAMHAIQDSFTHVMRTDDFSTVLNVGNWVEQVRGDLDEARDGHGHEKELDVCESTRPSAAALKAAAIQASRELYDILLAPAAIDARRAQLAQFFAKWFTRKSGCTVDNKYCGSAVYKELIEGTPGHGPWSADLPKHGCSSGGEAGIAAVLVLLFFVLRKGRAVMAGLDPAIHVIVLILVAGAARADEAPLAPGAHWTARASISLDNPAAAIGGGWSWAFESFDVGAIAEWNPWYAWDEFGGHAFDPGALNAYLQSGYRHPIGGAAARFALSLGTTTLLFEHVATRPGQTNPFIGFTLGEILLPHEGGGPSWSIVFADVALPFTQLRGWPFYYGQWRSTLTARW